MKMNNYSSKSLEEVWLWKEEIYEEHKSNSVEEMLKSILLEARETAKKLSVSQDKDLKFA